MPGRSLPGYVLPDRGISPAVLALSVLGALGLGAVVGFLLFGRANGGGAGGEAFDGTVYVLSNDPHANGVLALHYRAGSLRPLRIGEYPTGGRGNADLTESGSLDADGQIVLDDRRRLLFAVNQGSDSVASFRVRSDGSLEPARGSPYPSGGYAPSSLGIAGSTLVVANKAHDAVRDLTSKPARYTTFLIHRDGRLEPTGFAVEVPPRSSPTQAYVPPGSKLVVGTEETGPFRIFRVAAGGALAQAVDSPLAPEKSLFPTGYRGSRWALGIAAHPRKHLLYAELAFLAKLLVYAYDDEGRLTFRSAVSINGAKLPCWTTLDRAGRRLYTANAGNNTVSVFDAGTDPERPRQLQTLKLKGSGNPWGLRLDPAGRHLFVVDPRATAGVHPGQGNALHVLDVDADGTLSERDDPVPLPVALGTPPVGVAVLAR